MSVTTDADASGRITLAFELAALERFASPEDVFADAREWSRYVGVIANRPDEARAFLRAHDLRHDFELGTRDKWLALEGIRESTDTPRYVFVGETRDDRMAARGTGWEFVGVGEAAEKAGWERGDDRSEGILDRLLEFVSDG